MKRISRAETLELSKQVIEQAESERLPEKENKSIELCLEQILCNLSDINVTLLKIKKDVARIEAKYVRNI